MSTDAKPPHRHPTWTAEKQAELDAHIAAFLKRKSIKHEDPCTFTPPDKTHPLRRHQLTKRDAQNRE